MSAAPLPSPGMTSAVSATPELIVLIENNGSQIVLTDMPVLGWIVDPTGAAVPVILGSEALPAQWVRIAINTTHLVPGLIGAARRRDHERRQFSRRVFRIFDLASNHNRPSGHRQRAPGRDPESRILELAERPLRRPHLLESAAKCNS